MWVCRPVDMCMRGHVDMWVCGHVDMWACGHVGVWNCTCLKQLTCQRVQVKP